MRVFDTPSALMREAANLVVESAANSIAARGRFTWTLAGGSTPRSLYALLARPPHVDRISWDSVHFFWGDERCVPPDHAQSNFRMARESLLDTVQPAADHVHRMPGEAEPAAGAEAHERHLRRFFSANGSDPGVPPRMDLVLLGLGPDGHTASLFPGATALRETERWVIATHVDQAVSWRLSLTLPVLNRARHVAFLVVGTEKAGAVRAVLSGRADGDVLPAGRVAPEDGEVSWFLDAAAAAEIGESR